MLYTCHYEEVSTHISLHTVVYANGYIHVTMRRVSTHISLHPVHSARVDVDHVSLVLSEPVHWNLVPVQLIQDGPPRA